MPAALRQGCLERCSNSCKQSRARPVSAQTHLLMDIHTYAHAQTRTQTQTHTRACTCTHAHIHKHARMHTISHTNTRACTQTSTHTHTHTHIHTHTHTHTHTRARTHALAVLAHRECSSRHCSEQEIRQDLSFCASHKARRWDCQEEAPAHCDW